MYTENSNAVYDEYDENENMENNQSNSSNKLSLIIKILIIIVCVILLIWLFSKLGKKNDSEVTYDPNVHVNNVEKVRLASEEYFFIKKNLPENKDIKKITLETLIKENLIDNVIDSEQKTCNELKTIISMEDEDNDYTMKIKLSCSKEENEEVFYYKKDNWTCLNCNGVTKVNAKLKEQYDDYQESNDYSCNNWSNWTTVRVNNSFLDERVRKVYLGLKKGGMQEEVVYSEWSDYQLTPITTSGTDIEVEEKVVVEDVWSDIKTSTSLVTASDTIKVVSVNNVSGESYKYCPKGYNEDNKRCVSETKERGNLTYLQYNSGDYIIYNKPCDSLNTVKNDNGGYDFIYTNCLYSKVIDKKAASSPSYTVYNYQELEKKENKYYRYRTKQITMVQKNDEYTTEYYEENKMPNGFVKIDNSVKEEYSYKLNYCEK